MDGVVDVMVLEDYKLMVEVKSISHFHLFILIKKHFSLRKLALSLAKNSVNPIDKAQEHNMSIRANCLTWREYQMRLIQYQGMVYSRNDGTFFNVLGMGAALLHLHLLAHPIFTDRVQCIANNLDTIIRFLIPVIQKKAKARSFL